jgi:N-6 DNA Methylase
VEYKGSSGSLLSLGMDNALNLKQAAIQKYALNGAVHYALGVLESNSGYSEVIAIGINGFPTESNVHYEVAARFISKSNNSLPLAINSVDEKLSIFRQGNASVLFAQLDELILSDAQREQIRLANEHKMEDALQELNEFLYTEKGVSPAARINIIAALIMASMPSDTALGLKTEDLRSSLEAGNTDADIILRKVKNFLEGKHIPKPKQDTIFDLLKATLYGGNLNTPSNGVTELKNIFDKIQSTIGPYYQNEHLAYDFSSKLFNVMYAWVPVPDGGANDVVLTPTYIGRLLVRLAHINKNSYVLDLATGSGGLLISALHRMIDLAKQEIVDKEELEQKIVQIKSKQLIGIEILSDIYMLCILNMILAGDGTAGIINDDSFNYEGMYAYDSSEVFPADAMILNPPYSAQGNGMVFVEKALGLMKRGRIALIIQSSAGSGKAAAINKRILKQATLVASIRMPGDLFKASVQTHIYVFDVGTPHNAKSIVKFIDFSNDGYTRSNRKKAKAKHNLRDTGNARERYDELVNVIDYGKSQLNILEEKVYYENTIDPDSGADWNQRAPVDPTPTEQDFMKVVGDYLAWEVSQVLKGVMIS